MYLIDHLFDSLIFAIINAIIALCICGRLFRVMRAHCQIISEAKKFNSIVLESRASLDYINSKVSEGMDQMKEDIAKELTITDCLTRLSSKVATFSQHYSGLEEKLLEIVRMDHNMKNVWIETPGNINDEVKNILMTVRKKQPDRPQTPKKLRMNITSTGTKDSLPRNSTVKTLTLQSYDLSDLPSPAITSEKEDRPHTPIYPEVQLLNDPKPVTDAKPIGFRPSWKCDT